MLVIEKRDDVATLRALGAPIRSSFVRSSSAKDSDRRSGGRRWEPCWA